MRHTSELLRIHFHVYIYRLCTGFYGLYMDLNEQERQQGRKVSFASSPCPSDQTT